MKEIERKNPDGSLTIGCLEDTIKAPKKETKTAPKEKYGKKPKAKTVEVEEYIIDEDGVVIE